MSQSGRSTALSNRSGSGADSPDTELDPYAIVIPPLLKVIDKELTIEKYRRLLGSAEFLAQTVRPDALA